MIEQREHPRTHYIHRISYSTQERIVGTFVLIAFCILVGLLLSSGKTKNLFEDYLTIYGELQSVQAINKDTKVTISGLPAGSVSSVDITDQNRVIVTMKILKKYHKLLRTDSQATLASLNLAVIEKSTIEITAGSGSKPLLEDGSTIPVKEAFNIKDMMSKVEPIFATLENSILRMNQILAAIDTEKLGNTLDNVNASTANVNQILATFDSEKLGNMVDNMNAITTNINQISEHVRAGQGPIGLTLYDDEFKTSIRSTVTNMEQASIKINLLLNDIKQQVENVPELLEKIGPLLKEADKTIKATQNIWPLSSAVKQDENKEILVPPGQ